MSPSALGRVYARSLTRSSAIGALRRGGGIEQFLGAAELYGVTAIQWTAASPTDGQYRVSLHTVADVDDDRCTDLAKFQSLDPVGEGYVGKGRDLARTVDEEEATEQPRCAQVPW